jgi:hypothetical protein
MAGKILMEGSLKMNLKKSIPAFILIGFWSFALPVGQRLFYWPGLFIWGRKFGEVGPATEYL